jgi:hypothetical protein
VGEHRLPRGDVGSSWFGNVGDYGVYCQMYGVEDEVAHRGALMLALPIHIRRLGRAGRMILLPKSRKSLASAML